MFSSSENTVAESLGLRVAAYIEFAVAENFEEKVIYF